MKHIGTLAVSMFKPRNLALAVGFAATFGAGFAAADKPDFSGVWEMADFELVTRHDENNPQYTEQARAQLEYYQENFDPVVDDPARFCVRKGMPWTITSRARTYPTEIYQDENRIVMLFEYMDNRRVVHLDGRTWPDGYSPSSEGYSVGRWEGDTLVIETTGLTAHHEIGPYVRSEEAKVTERWRLVEHPDYGETIDITVVMEDPEVLLQPATGRQVFKRAPEEVVVGGYNCDYEVWDRHVSSKEQGSN